MGRAPVRIAVRAVLMDAGRLLLVNAWPGRTHLWCAPGGGVEAHASLPDNLIREVREETGLSITVGAPCLVNEFHDPQSAFHQIDIYFRALIVPGSPRPTDWSDPEGVVFARKWVSQSEFAELNVKPDTLGQVAWPDGSETAVYDPLEPIVR